MTPPLRCLGTPYRRALMLGLLCSLAACSLSRPSPVKDTYLLQVTPPTQASPTPQPATLKIATIAVAAPFRGKVLTYREGELKYETDFYNEFLVSPSAMLTDTAGAWLAAARVFRDVLPASANTDGDFVLEGFVSEFYGDFRDSAKPTAVISAKFFLVDNRSAGGVPMWQTELNQRVAISSRSAQSVAAGLNTAWSTMLAELTRQLGSVQLPATKSARTP